MVCGGVFEKVSLWKLCCSVWNTTECFKDPREEKEFLFIFFLRQKVNFPYAVDGVALPKAVEDCGLPTLHPCMPYCGVLIDTVTFEVRVC